MREVIEWIDKEVERLDREIDGEETGNDGQNPAPELLKAALRNCV